MWQQLISSRVQHALVLTGMLLKVPDAPVELKEWGQQTAIGLYFGLLVGGSRQYFLQRSTGKPYQAKLFCCCCLCSVLSCRFLATTT